MILKQEILLLANMLQLPPTTVEKDYVLSWVLYGISQNVRLSEWYFKGGTCLKKCYFETYRFSEDLDFTVPPGAIYGEDEIKSALESIAVFVYENTGINLKSKEIEVKSSINKNGKKTYIAKYTYTGPLNLPSRNQQRVKFDITDDEIIVDLHDMREIFHLYSDAPTNAGKVKCYSVNEILAEKTRAIYERQGRARDIYDIVNISRNFRDYVNFNIAREGLIKKFFFKSLPSPTVELIFSQLDFEQLKAGWENQLGHQLEILPPVESFYNELRSALSWWIDEHLTEPILATISDNPGETIIPRVHFPEPTLIQKSKAGSKTIDNLVIARCIDQIRYAARNRLCIEITYHGIKRLVEPYSLRLSNTGNQLLYVYELTKNIKITNTIKSYKVSEIMFIEVKHQPFIPRYAIEL